jgi:hypothetical protein
VAESKDPFTIVYRRLLSLQESVHFGNIVAAGNRITFLEFDPLSKDRDASGLPADFPDIMLKPAAGGTIRLGVTSSSSQIDKVYGFRIRFGHNRKVDEVLYPLQWAFACAMAELLETHGDNLGYRFVAGWAAEFDEENNLDENLLLQGLEGWQQLVNVRVTFAFNTGQLARGVIEP